MTRKTPTPRIAILAAMVFILALVPAALADKGGIANGGSKKASDPSGTISSPVLVNDLNGDGLANYGDTVTFNISTAASYPGVTLTCYQNGDWVVNQTAGMWWPEPNFYLFSWKWAGGAADCTAILFSGSTTLATRSFHVYA